MFSILLSDTVSYEILKWSLREGVGLGNLAPMRSKSAHESYSAYGLPSLGRRLMLWKEVANRIKADDQEKRMGRRRKWKN